MKKFYTTFAILILTFGVLGIEMISAQKKINKKTAAKPVLSWDGNWTVPSRFAASNLSVKMISADKFQFELEAFNGANMGELSGTAKIKGAKAVYDDGLSTEKGAEKHGCRLNFTHKGEFIEIKQTSECQFYAGNAVIFAGEYHKNVMVSREDDFVAIGVFPDKKLDLKFKNLVGWDYEQILNAFHLVSEIDNLDAFGAKVFSACVRGICPYKAGIIMYDDAGALWAAHINIDDGQKAYINYYSSVAAWKDKMPKTIENWVKEKKDLNEDVVINYKKN